MFTFPSLRRFVFNEIRGTTPLRTFFERHPLLWCIGYSAIEFNTAAAHSLRDEYLLQEMNAYEGSALGISVIVDVMGNRLTITTLTIHSASWEVLDNSLTCSALRACPRLREFEEAHLVHCPDTEAPAVPHPGGLKCATIFEDWQCL
ncbi:hypothetical protein GG344DRAFT_83614 [Lentinula edodes]|nr:hypothetical protein GG344DRAFT_83614 [Lentinula edodes]